MMRTKAQKEELVTALAEKLRRARTIYVTDFTGLSVARITELRRKLQAVGVEYLVVKNTLARRALDAGGAVLRPHLDGPTALVLGGTDPVAPARVLAEFAREHERPAIRAGVLAGAALTADQVRRLATLPARPELLGQLGAVMQAPLSGFVGAVQGLLYSMVGALEALRSKRATSADS